MYMNLQVSDDAVSLTLMNIVPLGIYELELGDESLNVNLFPTRILLRMTFASTH